MKGEAAREFVALCAGTDGADGNSPAAGAVADQTTLTRARARGLRPEKHLEESDAFILFNTLGDAIITGPTGTNVRDLRILLARRIRATPPGG
jgi:glycerate 2-kinase